MTVRGTALLLLVIAAPGAAQTVDELVSRNIDARGGYARLKSIESLRITRVVGTPFIDIDEVIYKKRPGRYRSEQVSDGRPAVTRVVGERSAWEQVGASVVPRPPALETEARETDADFDGILVDYRQKGHAIELVGRETGGGLDLYRLRVLLKSGAVREVYLDAATFLERKVTGLVTLKPGQQVPVTILYDDYRDVDGLRIPFAISEERDAAGQDYAIYVRSVELNPSLDDELFDEPAPGGV